MDHDFASIQKQLAAGDLSQATNALRKFVQNHAEHVEALEQLSQLECQEGRFAEAIRCIQQAIELQPDVARLRHRLGSIYFSAGDTDQSIEAYLCGLAIEPNDAYAYNNLGVAFKTKGRLQEAVSAFQTAFRLHPELAFPHRNLADVLRLQGNLDLAITHYDRALQLAPGDAESHNGLGLVFSLQDKPDEAIAQFQLALRVKADYEEAKNNLATTLCAADKFEEAVPLYESAIQQRPDFVTARVNLGSLLIELGQFDKAIEHLEYALKIDPRNAVAFHNLGDLALANKYEFSEDQLHSINSLIESGPYRQEDAAALHFTLAGILDKQKLYDEAFKNYQLANDLQYRALKTTGVPFDPARHHQKLEKTKNVFGRDFFQSRQTSSQGLNTEVPVIVVGMPRSGTSLVEQIISSHPNAAGAGELEAMEQLSRQLPEIFQSAREYPDCVLHAEAQTIQRAGRMYLDQLTSGRGKAKRVVDKTWYNFYYLGLISLLFPRARIIHCRRETMDVCISCFCANFNSIQWAWRFEDIGFFYRSYTQLMDHWQEVLPLPIHELSYEQLVADHESASRKLIEFCGLDWSERCLEFYENKRPVQTASRVQVRQPIYNTSIGRWKKYESHLSPLRKALTNRTPTGEPAIADRESK